MKWETIDNNDIPTEGASAEIVVAGNIVALFNVDGELHALDGICPHQGGPLGQGALHGCVVSCPWHGWEYDVTDGQHQSIPALKHTSIQVRTVNGVVQLGFSDA